MIDILILTGESSEARQLEGWLSGGWNVVSAANLNEAEALLDEPGVRTLVCSDELTDESGLMFIARTQSRWPGTRRILMATDLDGSLFFHAMHEVDIFSYLRRPFDKNEFVRVVSHAANDPKTLTGVPRSSSARPNGAAGGWGASLGVIVGLVVLATVLVVGLIACAYLLKSALGIDFFPDWHFWELLGG